MLAGQRIASKIRNILKHKGLRPSIKTQNEKLLKIPVQKQAIYRDHGGGIERRAGVRDHNVLLRMAEYEREQALSGSGQDVRHRCKGNDHVKYGHDREV